MLYPKEHSYISILCLMSVTPVFPYLQCLFLSLSLCVIEVDCVLQSSTLSGSQANVPEPFRAQHTPQTAVCDWSGWHSIPALSAARHPDTPLFRACKILTYASNHLLSLSCVPFCTCDGRQCMAIC